MCSVRDSADVGNMLKSKQLQDIILSVEKAENRGDALESALNNYPELQEFITVMLGSIGRGSEVGSEQ